MVELMDVDRWGHSNWAGSKCKHPIAMDGLGPSVNTQKLQSSPCESVPDVYTHNLLLEYHSSHSSLLATILVVVYSKLFFEENSNFELGMRRVFLNFHSPCFWAELTSIIFIGVKIFRVSTLMLTTQTGYC